MTEDKSTPRPWKVYDEMVIGGADGLPVALMYRREDQATPNASLIVSAVNSHDALRECVEALKNVVREHENADGASDIPTWIYKEAKSALSRLEKANG